MAISIHVPAVPAALRISQMMWEDFVCDPVLAAYVVYGARLDAFQAARLRYYWWVQNVIDSSGVSTGKSIVDFIFLGLRNILIPDHVAAIYYPTFGTGKNEFWEYFRRFAGSDKAKIFKANLGDPLKVDPGDEPAGDGTTHGPDCYKAFYRNGSRLLMPATNAVKNMVTSASLRLNTLVLEEWPHLDAMGDGIDDQLIDRCTRESWNKNHPIWGNHIVYTAHAETRLHPGGARYKRHETQVKQGNPLFANIAYSYKDYSDLMARPGKTFRDIFRSDATINTKRATSDKSKLLGHLYGIWGAHGSNWFSEQAIEQAVALGLRRGTVPVLSRAQFMELQASARN